MASVVRAWNMRTRRQETQLGTWLWSKGLRKRRRKKGCWVPLFKKKKLSASPFSYKLQSDYKLRNMATWCIDHYYYYSTLLLIYFCWQASRDTKDIEPMEIALMHYKSPKSIFVLKNRVIFRWCIPEWSNIAREKQYSIMGTKPRKCGINLYNRS